MCDFTQQNYEKSKQKCKRDLQVIILDSSPSTILAEVRSTPPFLHLSPKFPLQICSTVCLEPLTNVVRSPHLNAETVVCTPRFVGIGVVGGGGGGREEEDKKGEMQSCSANSKAYRLSPYVVLS